MKGKNEGMMNLRERNYEIKGDHVKKKTKQLENWPYDKQGKTQEKKWNYKRQNKKHLENERTENERKHKRQVGNYRDERREDTRRYSENEIMDTNRAIWRKHFQISSKTVPTIQILNNAYMLNC